MLTRIKTSKCSLGRELLPEGGSGPETILGLGGSAPGRENRRGHPDARTAWSLEGMGSPVRESDARRLVTQSPVLSGWLW